MHFATKAGHLEVVKLFIMSSADAQAETKDGKVPLCFAAANNHVKIFKFQTLNATFCRLNAFDSC
jgi:ankyrin repeat protein